MWRATYLAANSSSVSPEVFLSFSHFAATSLSLLPILADRRRQLPLWLQTCPLAKCCIAELRQLEWAECLATERS